MIVKAKTKLFAKKKRLFAGRSRRAELKGHLTLLPKCGNFISDPTEKSSKLMFLRKKNSSIDLVRHVKIVMLILKNCLVIYERF